MSPKNSTQTRIVDEHADSGERTYATFNHLVGLLAVADGMGLIAFTGALVMWLVKSNDTPFLDDHGREAVNFQISMFVLVLVGWAIWGLFVAVTLGAGVLTLPIPLLGTVLLFLVRLVAGIQAAIAANRGEYYRYPVCIRFIAPADENKAYACNKDVEQGPIA